MSENIGEKAVDLRIQRSRKHIMEALFTLIHQKSFQKITVQDITTKAMVNRSTFYAHFTDKYDLFSKAIGARIRADLRTGLVDASGLNANNIRKLIIVVGKLMTNISNDCSKVPNDELRPLINAQSQSAIYEVVKMWVSNLPTSTETDNLALLIAGTIIGTTTLWQQNQHLALSAEQLADQLMPLIMNGIGNHLV